MVRGVVFDHNIGKHIVSTLVIKRNDSLVVGDFQVDVYVGKAFEKVVCGYIFKGKIISPNYEDLVGRVCIWDRIIGGNDKDFCHYRFG